MVLAMLMPTFTWGTTQVLAADPPAVGDTSQQMPPMGTTTNAQRHEAAQRAAAARVQVAAAAAQAGPDSIQPALVPGPGTTPDYFGTTPNWANSPIAQQNLPAVSFSAPPAGGTAPTATAIVSNNLAGITVTDPGIGYTSPPSITITGGGGAGATASASITGVLSGISLTNGGSGYTSPPQVFITGGGGTGATAVTTIGGQSVVTGITINNPGAGYTSAPTITFSGGGTPSAQATAIAVISGTVSGITIVSRGTGYTSPPTIVFSGGGATTQAQATATIVNTVNTVNVSAGGSGYTSAPTVGFTGGGGTNAAATANISNVVSNITVSAGGTGYTLPPSVNLSGGGATTQATATSTIANVVTGARVTAGGSGYTTAPVVNIAAPAGGGTQATATATIGRVVANITVTAGGTGYTTAPSVVLTGGGGTGATAVATVSAGRVSAITVTAGGSGYTTAPTISFNGGGGTGAAATAAISATSQVTSIIITNRGSGYTGIPAITFNNTGTGGTGAAATATVTGVVVSVTVNPASRGSGYTSAPTVSFTGGGGGSGAAATTAITGSVVSVTLTNRGTGYTSAPTVGFTGGAGTGAAATATLTGALNTITITNPGTGYTSLPTVTFSGGGATAQATGTANLSILITGAIITSGGVGYTGTPIVTFSPAPAGGTTALGTAVVSGSNSLTGISIVSGGSGYTAAPIVSFTGGNGSGAAATASISGGVASIAVTTPGSGYTTAPTVFFTGGGGTGASATATISTASAVSAITLGSGGSGYTSVPGVSFSGGGPGTGAAATAVISGAIASINVTTPGTGYTSVPSIFITGGGGSGATATATLSPAGGVISINLTNKGSGYTSIPSVVISGGGGGGATATAAIDGIVTGLSLSNPGSAYSLPPVVSFTGGGTPSAPALAISTIDSIVTGVTALVGGAGYTSAPSVAIGGPGLGATATATISGPVASVSIGNGGTGYTAAPLVTVTPPVGNIPVTAATATASISGVTAINLGVGGTLYTVTPIVTITNAVGDVTGSGATATAILSGGSVSGFTITNKGSGYTANPTVSITPRVGDTTGSGATATAVASIGVVTGLTFTPGTGYNANPSITIAAPTAGTTATATAAINGTVTAVTITNAGSGGYITVPTITIGAPTGASPVQATVTAVTASVVTGLTLLSVGSGYTSAPTVVFTNAVGDTTGNGAAATASFASVVSAITVTAAGTGYTSAPAVAIIGGGGLGASATVNIGGGIASIAVNNGGTGYNALSPIVINITGGGGSGAVASAVISASVIGFNLTNGGGGYTSTPVVTVAASPAGAPATATAVMAGGTVTGFTVTSPGTGYSSAPTVSLTGGGGTGATATAAISASVTGLVLTNFGFGYSAAPGVVFTNAVGDTTGSGASAIAAISAQVTSVTLTNPGTGYTSVPSITIGPSNTAGGIQAVAAINGINSIVSSITLSNQGTGYTSAPTIIISAPNVAGGRQAVATATLATTGSISGFNITYPGSGYITAPTVTLTTLPGRAGSGATATATLGSGSTAGQVVAVNVVTSGTGYGTLIKDTSTAVTGILITNGGSGFTSAPTVTISGGGGTGATARAWIALGRVNGITITNGGSNYTTVPSVTISGGGGTGATGTAIIAYNKTIGVRKFVDSLPGLNAAGTNNLGQYIPVAIPDTTTYPNTDYYEIALVRYTEQMNSDLPPTELQGYVQTNTTDATVKKPNYLGPIIVAQENRAVRIKFTNLLPTGADGNLFIPVDTTVMGSGMSVDGVNSYTQNRATLHLHGGATPWISDGTPDQWTTPATEITPYPKGVDVQNVPDMWYDPVTHVTVPAGTAGATNNPGAGSMTFYYTNQQSARLMFYHDHAYGITRLNVYTGQAAGYIVRDPTEQNLITTGVIPAAEIPLVIQDRTFVPGPTQLAAEDPTWQPAKWGGTGNLWFPHVYMPNQNPADPSGTNAMGRWDYGPWFWPPYQGLVNGPKPNPYFVAGTSEGPTIPGVPDLSLTPEAFMDTPVVNGTAYPFLTIEPKAYRFRILNASNDRALNLSLFYAASNGQMWDATTGALLDPNAGEVPMVPAVAGNPSTAGYSPDQLDGRAGGVPDARAAGPDLIQIGSEGGVLPATATIANQPIGYEYFRRSITVLNVSTHSLFIGPAERADVIVDFSQVPPGSKLILYNDAPTPVPAFDTRTDYYTGDPDQTDIGGAPTTQPGYGPNTRTVMQFQVAGTPAAAFNKAALDAAIPAAFAATQPKPIIPVAGYDAAYNANFPADAYARIQDTSLNIFNTLLSNGALSGVQVTNGGSGYTANPAVTIAPPAVGTTATATAVVGGLTSLVLTSGGSGYTAPVTVTISAPGGAGVRATAVATVDGSVITAINITNPGSLYTTNPTVTISGGPGTGAAATATVITGAVTSFTLTNAGTGYTSVPIVTIGAPTGTGPVQATAIALGVNITMQPKAIQELFEVTYGRMNATLGVELPNTNATIQTTIPYGYIDPPTELMLDTPAAAVLGSAADGTQVWKITHNGVDTHFIHFHLFNVQVLNRVGWDGTVKPPDANELGWKETVRMNPLEDIIVAMRPTAPTVPFKMANAVRPLDLVNPLNSTGQFFGVDPNNNPVTVTNTLVNFGFEYVWHCHILGHEENDMMRPIILVVPPDAPSTLTATRTGTTVNLRWIDNAANESGFVVQRATDAAFTSNVVTFNANSSSPAGAYSVNVSYADATVSAATSYYYRVMAINTVGYGNGYPQMTANSAYTAAINVGPTPAAPTNFRATAASATQVNLTWTNNAAGAAIVIQRATNSTFTAGLTVINLAAGTAAYSNTGLTASTAYYYRIYAVNGASASAMTNATPPFPVTTLTGLLAPAAPSNLTITRTSPTQMSLRWTNNAVAPNAATGVVLQRATNNTFTAGLVTFNLAATTRLYTDTTVVSGTLYYYRVYAFNAAGNSAYANVLTAMPLMVVNPASEILPMAAPTAPTAFRATADSATQITLLWTDTNTAATETSSLLERSTASNFGANLVQVTLSPPDPAITPPDNMWYVDTSVSAGTSYYYRVTATQTGVGGGSVTVNAPATDFPVITPGVASAPAAPTAMTATAASATQVNLAWVDNANNESGYVVERATSADFATNWTNFNLILAPNTTSYSDTTTVGNTSYYYRVNAFNSVGVFSAFANAAPVTTPAPVGVPAAPSGLTAIVDPNTLIPNTAIRLDWTDNSSNETGFHIFRSTNGVFSPVPTFTVATANTTTFSDNTVVGDTNYYYQVTAYNASGDSQPSGSVVGVILLPPAAPTLTQAIATSSTTVHLQWTDNSATETAFIVQRSTDAGFTAVTTLPALAANTTSYDDPALTASTTYWYQVIANNAAGQNVSGPLSVTTQAAGVITTITIETAVDGTGALVPAQTLTVGSALQVYAIFRDQTTHAFIANVAADSWSLTITNGNVAAGDLVAAVDKKSAVMTGNLRGSGVITATTAAVPANSGMISVVAGPATQLRIETSANGTGAVVSAQSLNVGGAPLTLYAITRDAFNTFVANPSVTWSLTGTVGNVVVGDLSSTTGASVVLTPNHDGTPVIHADNGAGLTGNSGIISIIGSLGAAHLAISQSPASTLGVSAAFTTQPWLLVTDAGGNPVNGTVVTVSLGSGTGTLRGTLTATSGADGLAKFTDLGYSKTDAFNLHFAAGALSADTTPAIGPLAAGTTSVISVETAANGSGSVVATQTLTVGQSITVYSIARDQFGNFIANAVPDSWSLVGSIVNTDLTPAVNNKSATLTANSVGSAVIHAPINGITSVDSGTITVAAAVVSGGGGGNTGGGGSTPTPAPIITPVSLFGVTALGNAIDSAGTFKTTVVAKDVVGTASVTVASGVKGLTASGVPLVSLTVTPMANPPAPPQDTQAVGVFFDFGPTGATFSAPVTITLTYDPAKLAAGTDPSTLYIAWYDTITQKWVNLPGVVDLVKHTISATVNHFTLYSILYPKPAVPVVTPTVTATPTITAVVTPTATPVITTTAPVTTTPAPIVTSTPTQVVTTTSAPAPKPSSNNTWLIIAGAIVVIAVVIAVMVYRRKRA